MLAKRLQAYHYILCSGQTVHHILAKRIGSAVKFSEEHSVFRAFIDGCGKNTILFHSILYSRSFAFEHYNSEGTTTLNGSDWVSSPILTTRGGGAQAG